MTSYSKQRCLTSLACLAALACCVSLSAQPLPPIPPAPRDYNDNAGRGDRWRLIDDMYLDRGDYDPLERRTSAGAQAPRMRLGQPARVARDAPISRVPGGYWMDYGYDDSFRAGYRVGSPLYDAYRSYDALDADRSRPRLFGGARFANEYYDDAWRYPDYGDYDTPRDLDIYDRYHPRVNSSLHEDYNYFEGWYEDLYDPDFDDW